MTKEEIKCPTCGGPCRIEWSGLELVENSGDETLATKNYIPITKEQSDKELLRKYSEFLENYSYMDDDWRSEVPNAIDGFLNQQ